MTEKEIKAGLAAFDLNGGVCLLNPRPTSMLSPIQPEGNGVMEPNEIMMKFSDAGLKQEDLADLIAYLASIHNGLRHAHLQCSYDRVCR